MVEYETFIATDKDIESIVEVTNDAFQADAFFKKPEYHLRFDLETVRNMINSKSSVFIIAVSRNCEERIVLGSIFLKWAFNESANDKKVGLIHSI